MNYDINAVLEGVGSVLAGTGYTNIYVSNRQQGIKTPCFFISLIPGGIKDEVDGRYLEDLGLDIVFLQDPNIVNATDNIFNVLSYIDENLATIPYTDGDESDPIPLHTYEREYHMEGMELHYQLHIKNRVHIAKTETKMASLEELTYEIKVKH